MAKTEVILTSNIPGLGAESDQVKVAAGYARNYLYPQGLAIPLSAGNKKQIESLRRRRAEREAHDLNSMSELGKALQKLTCIIAVKTGDDGKMFGNVTSGTIADHLKTQFDILLDKKKIHLEKPIRTLGDHEVEMRLHADVQATLKVQVISTTPAPIPVADPAPGTEDERKDRERERERERERRPGRRDAKVIKADGKVEKLTSTEKPAKAKKG